MMTQDSSLDINGLETYENEMSDVRAALRKAAVAQPDIDREWQRFASAHDAEHGAQPTHTAWLWRGIAIGVAATLLCLLAITPLLKDESTEPLVVISAVKQNPEVEMTATTPAAYAANDRRRSHAQQQSRTVTVAQREIDIRKATTTNAAEERTVRTPRGKDMKIVLADGTEVLLNADSRLRFPTRFTGSRREVVLEGEAYFTVAKDKEHPFIVKSGKITTTALGTEFNVKAYNEKETCITLINGSVAVNDSDEQQKVILQPGQDVSTVDGKLIVADANPKVFTYWKEGFFYFDNVPLIDILTELGRWYNVTIELKSRLLMSYRLHFAADRNCDLSEAIERLNKFSYLRATFNGKKVVIDKAVAMQK